MTSSVRLLERLDLIADSNRSISVDLVEFVISYLVHSTLLIGAAWFVVCFVSWRGQKTRSRGIQPATEERLWKLAIVLSLFTSLSSVGAGWSHPVWKWSFSHKQNHTAANVRGDGDQTGSTEGNRETARTVPLVDDRTLNGSFAAESRFEVATIQVAPSESSTRQSTLRAPTRIPTPPTTLDEPMSTQATQIETEIVSPIVPCLALIFTVWMSVGLIRLFVCAFKMEKWLAQCQPIEGALHRELCDLVPSGQSIRVLRSSKPNGEPSACGFWRCTIVLPAGIEQRLAATELRALMSHEVAHLIRRDPQWLLIGEFFCTCLAFQPLNFLARRRWQQISELLCDDWVVEQDVSALSLASCLARIAEWKLNQQAPGLSVPAVGRSGLLSHRIEWLLRNDRATEPNRSRNRTLATLLFVVAGLLVSTFGPRLTIHDPLQASEAGGQHAIWDEIDHDLNQTLIDLSQIESLLLTDTDPEIALLAKRLRDHSTSLRQRQLEIRSK